jgi:hypothetical protein
MTFAMIVPACFMIVPWTYAFCVNFVPAYRDVVDQIPEKEPMSPSRVDEEAGRTVRDTYNSETPMINLNKPLPEVSKSENIDTTDTTDKHGK